VEKGEKEKMKDPISKDSKQKLEMRKGEETRRRNVGSAWNANLFEKTSHSKWEAGSNIMIFALNLPSK